MTIRHNRTKVLHPVDASTWEKIQAAGNGHHYTVIQEEAPEPPKEIKEPVRVGRPAKSTESVNDGIEKPDTDVPGDHAGEK